MEIIWKWKNALLRSKTLAKMDMKLYGNHMEMEKRPSNIKNINYTLFFYKNLVHKNMKLDFWDILRTF